jgi:hypothetical protein
MMKNDNETKIGADIIRIVDSDDELQYVSRKRQGREDNIGGHVIDAEQFPQQHPLPLHSRMYSLQQHCSIALRQLPTCGGAMTTLDDDPLTTNFNASNVGFRGDRRLRAVTVMRQWDIFYVNRKMLLLVEIISLLVISAMVAVVEKLLPPMIALMALAAEIASL